MSIVVTGATGSLGRLVVADLLAAGVPAKDVTAVARDRQKAADLAARGVRVHIADYDEPGTLPGAFGAGDRVLLVSGSEVGRRVPQHSAVIDAAKAAGVAQLAYTGAFGGPKADFLLADEHRATEQLILDSGLPYTFLRNNWYSEVYAGDMADVAGTLERGVVANSVSDTARIATAPRADYAGAATAVLTGEGHLGRAYELSGDTAWTMTELAAELSRQSGTKVVHTVIAPEEYKKVLKGAGLPDDYADVLVDVDAAINRGLLAGTPGDLSRLLGRPTTPLADTIAATLAAQAA